MIQSLGINLSSFDFVTLLLLLSKHHLSKLKQQLKKKILGDSNHVHFIITCSHLFKNNKSNRNTCVNISVTATENWNKQCMNDICRYVSILLEYFSKIQDFWLIYLSTNINWLNETYTASYKWLKITLMCVCSLDFMDVTEFIQTCLSLPNSWRVFMPELYL